MELIRFVNDAKKFNVLMVFSGADAAKVAKIMSSDVDIAAGIIPRPKAEVVAWMLENGIRANPGVVTEMDTIPYTTEHDGWYLVDNRWLIFDLLGAGEIWLCEVTEWRDRL